MNWIEQIEILQNMLMSHATGGDVGADEFKEVRDTVLLNKEIADRLPRFVRTCRDLRQFWHFIKPKFPTYAERREYIYKEFQPVFEFLESQERSPADQAIAETLSRLDAEHVHQAWSKALERRAQDPEGAITSARTLLETVCKCILDDFGVVYDRKDNLPRLYRMTAESLNLAPDQHSEQIVRRMLGGCQSVVEGVGALRNVLSDSHGKGKEPIKPAPRHAELTVNLAGSMATFLVASWEAQKSDGA